MVRSSSFKMTQQERNGRVDGKKEYKKCCITCFSCQECELSELTGIGVGFDLFLR